jgi:hypothetical protein
MRSEPFCKRRCGSNERTRSWRARPEPERLTREVLSARHAPVQHHPERQDHQHHPFDRPPTQNGPAFALVIALVEPPAGIEPATHPYHGTTGNRCADRRFPRSRPTVGAKVIGSPSAKLCVLLCSRSTEHVIEPDGPFAQLNLSVDCRAVRSCRCHPAPCIRGPLGFGSPDLEDAMPRREAPTPPW